MSQRSSFKGQQTTSNHPYYFLNTLRIAPKGLRAAKAEKLQDHKNDNSLVERQKSALHTGDFRSEATRDELFNMGTPLPKSQPVAWTPSLYSVNYASGTAEFCTSSLYRLHINGMPKTLSYVPPSDAFSFHPPTSPLVQQSNSADYDISYDAKLKQRSRSPERSSRRYTFCTQLLQVCHGSCLCGYPCMPQLRRNLGFPYQAHQPRRSVSSITTLSTIQTPRRSLKGSFSASDYTPLHHAPMVGSYEESILRGRMSTNPSRPLNFVAQIGVLGKGPCPSGLRCPSHIVIPFPAVFYDYGGGVNRIPSDRPSPYVGLIDIENRLETRETLWGMSQEKHLDVKNNLDPVNNVKRFSVDKDISNLDHRRREKKKRRSRSPTIPPRGCYRIPPQGHLQIVIKNPNKTAVKLFIVPYDLSDMEAGQKTFIRQRSYSAIPNIKMPLDRENIFGNDKLAAISTSHGTADRPNLRYLIHINLCCPSKGRFYLYNCIRVVFANRVIDDKEKLQQEIQLPEPKYSVYKPSRETTQFSTSINNINSYMRSRKTPRRCSTGDYIEPG